MESYKQLERAFNKQYTSLNELAKKSSEIEESALQVRQSLEGLASAIDDIQITQQRQTHSAIKSLCNQLDQLHAEFEQSSAVTSQCHRTIKEKKEGLKTHLY